MPRIFKEKRETATEPRADDAQPRPTHMTRELLDWGLASMEAVLSTEEVRRYATRRTRQKLEDAMAGLDELYPILLGHRPYTLNQAVADMVLAAEEVPAE